MADRVGVETVIGLGEDVRPSDVKELLVALRPLLRDIAKRIRSGDEQLLAMNAVEMSAHVNELLADVLHVDCDSDRPQPRVWGRWQERCEEIGEDGNGNPKHICWTEWVPYVTYASVVADQGGASA